MGIDGQLSSEGFRSKTGEQLQRARILLNNTKMVTTRGNFAVEPFYRNRTILEPDNLRSLAVAKNAEGSGNWVQRYGNQDTADTSVVLDVPAGVNHKAQLDEATIGWALSSPPLAKSKQIIPEIKNTTPIRRNQNDGLSVRLIQTAFVLHIKSRMIVRIVAGGKSDDKRNDRNTKSLFNLFQ